MTEMLWGGRFATGPHPDMLKLTASIDVDIRLLEHDVASTRAHARALAAAGLLEDVDVAKIDGECEELVKRWRNGELRAGPTDEDVHSLVERELTETLGELGARIHAGRSRNDLVATDLRLWCRDASESCARLIAELVDAIADTASEHLETVMPGYTHLQRAQPVSLGFHLCAHGFALLRDRRRFLTARSAADVSALGAGALAGTTLPMDPTVAAEELGFTSVFDNAMDAVSDRDFAADFVYAAALCGVHLSRLAEEIVMWTSSEFGFAHLADEWSTGSSMMPQKRNPDMAELVRGRAAGGIGDLTALLGLLKGLPLAYDRDLQEDKGPVFRAGDRIAGALSGMKSLLEALMFDAARMEEAARGGATWATDLAEVLVQRKVPFRQAHGAVGSLVASLESDGLLLEEATTERLASHHPLLTDDDRAFGDPRRSLVVRTSSGGTSPDQVRKQIDRLRSGLGR